MSIFSLFSSSHFFFWSDRAATVEGPTTNRKPISLLELAEDPQKSKKFSLDLGLLSRDRRSGIVNFGETPNKLTQKFMHEEAKRKNSNDGQKKRDEQDKRDRQDGEEPPIQTKEAEQKKIELPRKETYVIEENQTIGSGKDEESVAVLVNYSNLQSSASKPNSNKRKLDQSSSTVAWAPKLTVPQSPHFNTAEYIFHLFLRPFCADWWRKYCSNILLFLGEQPPENPNPC